MCFWKSNKKDEKGIKIAEQDMVVYKVLSKGRISPYQKYKYEVGILQLKVNLNTQYKTVEKGYHFYIYPKVGLTNYKFIVPKGSKYYINDFEGVIVAETCMLTDNSYLTIEETVNPFVSDELQAEFNEWFIDKLKIRFNGELPTKEQLKKNGLGNTFGIYEINDREWFWYNFNGFYREFYDKFNYNFLILNILILDVLYNTLKLKNIFPNERGSTYQDYYMVT